MSRFLDVRDTRLVSLAVLGAAGSAAGLRGTGERGRVSSRDDRTPRVTSFPGTSRLRRASRSRYPFRQHPPPIRHRHAGRLGIIEATSALRAAATQRFAGSSRRLARVGTSARDAISPPSQRSDVLLASLRSDCRRCPHPLWRAATSHGRVRGEARRTVISSERGKDSAPKQLPLALCQPPEIVDRASETT